MTKSNKFYITTAIAYVNGAPHLGHALEMIQADCMARYHRLIGDETFFLTGTDEHGSKIYQTAAEQGLDTQELVDLNAAKFLELTKLLNISNDDFIRTTDQKHKDGVKILWNKLIEKGDIYKDGYEGLYCVGCEAFITSSDLTKEGLCPNHNKKPDLIKEENYFFRLSKYADQIEQLITSDELEIIPNSRKNEILSFIKSGLKDVSFSRPKATLPWGIEVPNDPEQVMYVWCDALTNYITGINYGQSDESHFNKFWPADIQLIGKDILRFHAAYWIAMLISAEIPVPKAIAVHGFITSDGQKMSKSIGNVVDPVAVANEFGADMMRYYLLKEVPTTNDGDFTQERFIEVCNADLANNIGNLLNRTLTMLHKNNNGQSLEAKLTPELQEQLTEVHATYQSSFTKFDLKSAAESVVLLAQHTNRYLEQQQPWQLAKTDVKEASLALSNALELVRNIAVLLMPFIPDTAEKMLSYLNYKPSSNFINEKFADGHQLNKPEILFQRVER